MTAVKTEWIMLCAVVLVTLAGSLAILRWAAPQLIGLPVDLRLVQTSETIPPFYEGVFRSADYTSSESLLNDPIVVLRAHPRFPETARSGPHDILGFRNRAVPNIADVVVIGDSQTYGNNVALEDNWPSKLAARLKDKPAIIYSMATVGWGAAQYLNMATKAAIFQPHVLVIAFYTGNDALESFKLAYGVEQFKDLRPVEGLSPADVPAIRFPAPPEETWAVTFKDGFHTLFTPTLRLALNDDHPAIAAGYAVMANAAREIRRVTQPFRMTVIFTIIPTKEFVYVEKLRRDGIALPPDYAQLVIAEGKRIAELAAALGAIADSAYVDLTAPLSAAALEGLPLYPRTSNGHPMEAGYAVIAKAIEAVARDKVNARPWGLVVVPLEENTGLLFLVNAEGVWQVPALDTALQNGWTADQVQLTSYRALAGLPRRGVLDVVDTARFGPGAKRLTVP